MRFLDLLATFDWKNQPLIVNFNNELQSKSTNFTELSYRLKKLVFLLFFVLKETQVVQISTKFKENRASLAVMHIVTPYDGVTSSASSLWTYEKPSIQQLCRCIIVAKSSYNLLKQSMGHFETAESFKVVN